MRLTVGKVDDRFSQIDINGDLSGLGLRSYALPERKMGLEQKKETCLQTAQTWLASLRRRRRFRLKTSE